MDVRYLKAQAKAIITNAVFHFSEFKISFLIGWKPVLKDAI